MSSYARSIIAVLLVLSKGLAIQLYTKDDLSSYSLSGACSSSLAAGLACPRQVGRFSSGIYFSVSAPEETCTPSYAAALRDYVGSATYSCTDSDVFELDSGDSAPFSRFATQLH
jgi:hypothetical protein